MKNVFFTWQNAKIPWILFIVLIGAWLRYSLYLGSPAHTTDGSIGYLYTDSTLYIQMMQYILANGLREYLMHDVSVIIASGNPLYLAAAYKIFGGHFQVMRQFGIVLSCIQIFLVYRIVLNLFGKKQMALLAALFLAVNKYIADFSYTFLTENLFLFFSLMALYLYTACLRKKMPAIYVALIGICLFFATLTRSIVTLLPFSLIIFYGGLYFFRGEEYKSVFKKWLAIGAVFYLLLTPLIIKNHKLFHTNALSTGAGTALYLGSRVESNGDEPPYYGQGYTIIYEIIGMHDHFLIESDKKLWAAGMENVKNNFPEYMIMNVKKIARLTIGTKYSWFFGQGDNLKEVKEKAGSHTAYTKGGLIFLYTGVFSFGLFGIYRWRRDLLVSGITLIGLYFLFLSVPFLAILRYGVILYVLAAMFAAAEIVSLYEERAWKKSLTAALLAVGMSIYICMGF